MSSWIDNSACWQGAPIGGGSVLRHCFEFRVELLHMILGQREDNM